MDNNFIFIQLLHLHIMCAACFHEIQKIYRPQPRAADGRKKRVRGAQ